ncbi:MAG: hypothetical protein NTY09_03980 [bacterium]|nr:hypothetical protein [bacterium]
MKKLWDIFIRGLALAWFTGMGYMYKGCNLLADEWKNSGAKISDASKIFKRLPPLHVPVDSLEVLQAIRIFDLIVMYDFTVMGPGSFLHNLFKIKSQASASDKLKTLIPRTRLFFLITTIILISITVISYFFGRETHVGFIILLAVPGTWLIVYILSFVRLILRLKTRDHLPFNRFPWEFAALFLTVHLPSDLSFGISDFEGSIWPYVVVADVVIFLLFIALSATALKFEKIVNDLRAVA